MPLRSILIILTIPLLFNEGTQVVATAAVLTIMLTALSPYKKEQ